MAWLSRQFSTRVIVLIPIAIAINIVLGQTVAAALKLPIYLDSIGTILVGAIAGPVPGMLTGLLANLLWTYVLPAPFNSQYAAPFAIVAVEIGFLAGIFGRLGWFRSRPNTSLDRLLIGFAVVVGILAVAFFYGFVPFYTGGTLTFFGDQTDVSPIFVGLAWIVAVLLILALVGFCTPCWRAATSASHSWWSAACSREWSRRSSRHRFRPSCLAKFTDRERPLVAAFQKGAVLTSQMGRPSAGAPIRSDRQDADVLPGLPAPPGAVSPVRGALPPGRAGRRVGGIALLQASDEEIVARLAPATPSPYHRLNPLTKAVAATVASVGAFVVGGYVGPLLILAAVLACAAVGGVLARLTRLSFLLTLPIAISVVLVSVFTRAGTTVLFSARNPFAATLEGVDFAGQTLVRLFTISAAIGLFGLTTDPRAFVFDLERRGLSPRFAFVAVATLEAVPAMVARAGVIAAAQRSRGLDTEGSVVARLRGILPLVAPVLPPLLVSAHGGSEVEPALLALEVRARPGLTRAENLPSGG